MTSRLFVAVVPPAAVVEDLDEFLAPRRARDDPLRWSDPLRWHFTIAFMPAADESRYEPLTERIEKMLSKRQPFELSIAGAGAFLDPADAKILWAGVAGDVAELERLSAGARTAASTSGIAVDGGKFHPHLTLARLNPPFDVTHWLRVLDLYQGSAWQVTEVQLIESIFGGKSKRGRRDAHAAHHVREVFKLTAAS